MEGVHDIEYMGHSIQVLYVLCCSDHLCKQDIGISLHDARPDALDESPFRKEQNLKGPPREGGPQHSNRSLEQAQSVDRNGITALLNVRELLLANRSETQTMEVDGEMLVQHFQLMVDTQPVPFVEGQGKPWGEHGEFRLHPISGYACHRTGEVQHRFDSS